VVAGGDGPLSEDVEIGEGGRQGIDSDCWARYLENNKGCMEKWMKNSCLDRMNVNPRYKVTSTSIGDYIQHMKDHALIRKFMGICPSGKDLMVWVKSHWKLKGKTDL
jgi:hypothetical protein